jgi:hypothetical protein
MSRPELYVVNEVAVVETGPDTADVLSEPDQGPPGVPGATGIAGPNLITDATALGTLTDTPTPAFLLVGAAAGDAARKLTPGATGLAVLLHASLPPSDGQAYSLTCTDGVLAWAVGTAPTYSASLDYSDGRNSQYLGVF